MSDPFIAEITMFGGNFAPRGWAFCDGQLLPISQHQALFSILGTTYGGDGRTTFGLPDLRGRVPIHAGNGSGLSDRRLGQRGGSESVTLTEAEMPSHSHSLTATTDTATTATPSTSTKLAKGNTSISRSDVKDSNIYAESTANPVNIAGATNAGGGQSHSNMQPYLVINYIIALQGIFPSRN